MAAISDPRNDVSHKVGVDPVDDAGIDISDLKQGWRLRVPGSAIDPDHVRHPPDVVLLDDHGHSSFDVEEDRIHLWRSDITRMINRHSPSARTDALAVVHQFWQRG